MSRCSAFVPSLRRAAALAAVGTALAAATGAAQLARPRTASPDAPKLLVLPFVRDNQDSALSLLVADGVRERLKSNHLDKFNTITRENLNQNLIQSGFPTDVPLEPAVARQLVRFLNAKFVIEGSMIRRPGDSLLVVARLVEAAGADPQAATTSLTVSFQRVGSGTGQEIVNRLIEGFSSFDEVAECRRRLDLRDFAGAIRKANEALRTFPNNAGAWVCIARIREAQNEPGDSVLAALRNAFTRDTLNTNIMRRIAAKYQAQNDTANLLVMLKRILTIDFRDNDLRISTVQMMVRMGQADSAVVVVDQALRENPASVELLGVKAIAVAAAASRRRVLADSAPQPAKDSLRAEAKRLFGEAAGTLAQVADIDTAKVDSLFLYRITNDYREAADSASWTTWTRRATERMPAWLDNWRALTTLRMVRNDSSGALDAARGYVEHIPAGADTAGSGGLRQHYGMSRYLLGSLQADRGLADSAVANADSAIRADSSFRAPSVRIYLQAGLRSYRDSSYVTAISRLQRARDYAQGRAVVPAAFYLGLSQVQLGVQVDAQAQNDRSCDAARHAAELWNAAEPNIIAGAAQNREAANNLLTNVIPAYKQRADALTHNNCH